MVSIIIPCFNGEKFIKRCINSVLNQTYKNIELIFINDGSIDNTEKKIEESRASIIQAKFKFKYIKTNNKGVASSINEGLSHVTGQFLTLLDVDDYLMNDSIKLRRDFLLNNKDYNIVRTNGYSVSERNINDKTRMFIQDNIEKNKLNIFDDLIEGKTNNWSGSYMVRVDELFEFYPNKKIYETRYGQNLQILLPLTYKAKSGFIDKPLMKYIIQETSVSKKKSNLNDEIKNILGYKDIRVNMVELIIKDDSKEKYLEKIEIVYARCLMDLAFSNRDKSLMEKNYKILKKNRVLTIQDKILYYNLKNRVVEVFFRVIKKIV